MTNVISIGDIRHYLLVNWWCKVNDGIADRVRNDDDGIADRVRNDDDEIVGRVRNDDDGIAGRGPQ